MIMGTGIFIMLCGLTYMLEVKDSKNRHFIVGDIYNNFIYNADPARSNQPLKKLRYPPICWIVFPQSELTKVKLLLSCLPTITSTMQAQLTQRDHDALLAQRVEASSSRSSRRMHRKCEFLKLSRK